MYKEIILTETLYSLGGIFEDKGKNFFADLSSKVERIQETQKGRGKPCPYLVPFLGLKILTVKLDSQGRRGLSVLST